MKSWIAIPLKLIFLMKLNCFDYAKEYDDRFYICNFELNDDDDDDFYYDKTI